MARITARQIKAQKRADSGYKQLYRKVMKQIRVPLLFRLGIMNNMALGECEETMDLMEEMGIKSVVQNTASGTVKAMRTATDALVQLAYSNHEQNRNFYVDICNHAYSEAEPMLKEMRDCIERFLENVKAEDVNLKARITISMLLIEMDIQVFKRMRKVNFAKYKVDIYEEFKVFDMSGLKSVWDKLQREYAQIPEEGENLDIFDVDGFRDIYDRLITLMTDVEFVNNQCKWAAAMNKEYMPELYENLRKEAEETAG